MTKCSWCESTDIKGECPCGRALYCSGSCQLNHWDTHKKLCQDTRTVQDFKIYLNQPLSFS